VVLAPGENRTTERMRARNRQNRAARRWGRRFRRIAEKVSNRSAA
jgi:hypothetical protein